jgi:hypothetical protein
VTLGTWLLKQPPLSTTYPVTLLAVASQDAANRVSAAFPRPGSPDLAIWAMR